MRSNDWAALALVPAVVCMAPARAQDYLTVAQAQHALFAEADSFRALDLQLTDEQRRAIRAAAGVRQRRADPPVWQAWRGDTLLGWFLVDEVVGKHEFITWALAITPDGHVRGLEILSYRETHGHEVRDVAWRARFIGKTADAELRLDADIPNISGATLSCRNLTDGVKRLLALHRVALAAG